MAGIAWHRRTGVIGVLLFAFPPLGIPLMWSRFKWTTKTKGYVAAASALWFVLVAARMYSDRGERDVQRTGTIERGEEQVSATPILPTTGAELVEQSPALLVPRNVDGLALGVVVPNKNCCGVHAAYISDVQVLDAELWLATTTEQIHELNKPDGSTEIEFGRQRGVLSDTAGSDEINVQWTNHRWIGIAVVHYSKRAERAKARAIAVQLASRADGLLEQYLIGPLPSIEERKAQMAAVVEANAARHDAKIARRVDRFLEKIRDAGVVDGVVAKAKMDPLGEGNDIIVTVGASWNRATKSERLQLAQTLWRTWALSSGLQDADAAHIRLVDHSGNRLGGSGTMGSSIELAD
jgi:hypothetical protein